MKKFKFTINGNQYDVEIGTIEDNNAQVNVNGTAYEVQIDRNIQQQKTPKLVRSTAVPSGDSAKSKTNPPDGPKGGGTVKSPLPGTILALHVKVGDSVKMGHKILTLEAMKMENVLYADRDGVIQSIQCANGDAVREGDVLMTIGD